MAHERYSHIDLLKFAIECFTKAGVPRDDARLIADHLVSASLRGVDSHGVLRIPDYIDGIEKGYVKVNPRPRILKETPISALMDGDRGFGIPIAMKAVELAITKAHSSGMAIIGVKNLGHVGMLAYYTKKLVEENLLGFACANCAAMVAPWGGSERILGTNPISIGIPAPRGNPIIVDMATSAIASAKALIALKEGKELQPNIALDKDGRPTRDPKAVLEEGTLLPFGGHKGYAISLVVEILSSALIGGPTSKEVPFHESTQGGFLLAALDPLIFRDKDEFEKDVLRLIDIVKNCRLREGFSEILIPGELEDREYKLRIRRGIPIDLETVKSLKAVAEKLGVPFPNKIS